MFNLATLEAKLGAVAIGIVLLGATHLGAYEYGKHVKGAQDTAVALQQQVESAKTKGLQDETTYKVAESYSEYTNALQSKLDWMRKHPSKNPVSTTTNSTQGTNAAISEFGRTCTSAFYENGLRDVVTLNAWQTWATEQHIPVK